MNEIKRRNTVVAVFTVMLSISLFTGCDFSNIFSKGRSKEDTSSVVAVDDRFSVEEGGSLEIPFTSLTANDVTGNKPPLTVVSVFNAAGGTVSLNSGMVLFTPAVGAGNTASFSYEVENALGISSEGAVTITVIQSTASRIITGSDTWSVFAGKSTSIPIANLVSNDIDQTDNPPTTIKEVKNAGGGTAVLNIAGGMITFTSTGQAGFNASFVYVAQNAAGITAEGLVTITVEEAPSVIANADSYDVIQGQQYYILKSELLQNDEGNGTLNFISISDPIGGTVSINGDTITFTATGYAYNPAGFSYTIEDTLGTIATGSVYINVTPLAPVEAYIYDDDSQLEAMKNSYVPPTVQDIFNTWGRFNGNSFYADKADAETYGDYNATAWQFLANPDRVSMPLNVDPYNGFVSNESLENYTIEATLTSTNGDNDTIGLVIAFVREGSTNYILSVLRTQGGTDPSSGWGITYGTGVTGAKYHETEWIIAEKSVDGVQNSWNGRKSRVKVVRNGDVIKCYTTNWNDENNYQASSEIVIDLASDPRLAKFRGPKPYGYSTFSQPDSTYLDIVFTGGINVNKLFNARTGQVWEYIQGSGWTLLGVTVQQDLGFVREVSNPETGKKFLIKQNSIELVN